MNTLRFQLYSWSVTVGQGIRHFLLPGLCNEHVKVSVSWSVTIGQGIGHSFTARIVQ